MLCCISNSGKVLALFVVNAFVSEGALMKALQKRSLAASGVPDPYCKTGVISLKVNGKREAGPQPSETDKTQEITLEYFLWMMT